MYRARLFFDAGSGTLLWSDNAATRERFDYPIELDELPVSAELRTELVRLVEAYDTSIDWDYPPDPTPWSEEQCDRFNAEVRAVLPRLRAELGSRWEIVDEFVDVPEG